MNRYRSGVHDITFGCGSGFAGIGDRGDRTRGALRSVYVSASGPTLEGLVAAAPQAWAIECPAVGSCAAGSV